MKTPVALLGILLVAAAPARGVDVDFQLDGIDAEDVVVTPLPVPGPESSLDFDKQGNLIGGTLHLEAHDRDGSAIGAWTRTLAPAPSNKSARFAIQSATAVGAASWPASEDCSFRATMILTRFVSQTDFAGRIEIGYGDFYCYYGESLVERYSFESSDDPGTPVCQNQRLYFDVDADGEEDYFDAVLGTSRPQSGNAVDSTGTPITEFCSARQFQTCTRADFRNDEPRKKHPKDCLRSNGSCRPAAAFVAGPIPPVTRATCVALPLFTDDDGDGEENGSDACPATPSGSSVDSAGCSAAQFCSAQPKDSCGRSDFKNDEMFSGKPGDCRRSSGRPRQCEPATP